MKKHLAVLVSDYSDNFKAIADYFNDKEIEITCLSNKLDSEVLKLAEELNINCRYLSFEETAGYLGANSFDLIALSYYDDCLPEDIIDLGRFVNIHPSLLPSFNGRDAIQRAYISGVKVSGITIHYLENGPDHGKIIAQYPVLIGNSTHFDEFEKEIHNLENLLYPIVIDKIIKDEVFDFSDLIGGCGGCRGCH